MHAPMKRMMTTCWLSLVLLATMLSQRASGQTTNTLIRPTASSSSVLPRALSPALLMQSTNGMLSGQSPAEVTDFTQPSISSEVTVSQNSILTPASPLLNINFTCAGQEKLGVAALGQTEADQW